MTVGPVTGEWLAGCAPLPASECRCDSNMPCQDPGEAARCAKCGLRLSPVRALGAGALPERDDEFDTSADPPPAEDAGVTPAPAIREPGPTALATHDGRPRRTGQAPTAAARTLGPGSPDLQPGEAA